MPQSKPEFEAVSQKVTSISIDFRTANPHNVQYLIARSLLRLKAALHEMLCRLV